MKNIWGDNYEIPAAIEKPKKERKLAKKIKKLATRHNLVILVLVLAVAFTVIWEVAKSNQAEGPDGTSKVIEKPGESKEPASAIQQEEEADEKKPLSWKMPLLLIAGILLLVFITTYKLKYGNFKLGVSRQDWYILIHKVKWIGIGWILNYFNGQIPYSWLKVPWNIIGWGVTLIVLVQLIIRYRRAGLIKPIFDTGKWIWEHQVSRTIVFLVPCLFFFYLLMVRNYPGFQIGFSKILDSDWREHFLFSSVFIFGIILLALAAFFHQRIWWKSFWLLVVALVVLAFLGFRPVFKIDGTYKSYQAFEILKPDSTLMAMYELVKAKPDVHLRKSLAKHKNDYTNLHLRTRRDNIIAVYAKGTIQYGPNDFLAKDVRAGRAFATKKTRKKLRDPEAHPFSPVIGHKSYKLGIVSALTGSSGNPEKEKGTLFFLRVIAEDEGDLFLLPSNMPRKNYYYGSKEFGYSSDMLINIYHLSAEKMAKLAIQ